MGTSKKGSLNSTALMLIGAKSTGVSHIYIGLTPKENGYVDTATVAACKLAGTHRIFVGNGPSILAGFAIGIETIPEVDEFLDLDQMVLLHLWPLHFPMA